MASVKQATVLKHQANLGEGVEEVDLRVPAKRSPC